ncbi:MAG: hypothetical protein FJ095_16530 [Deltaproteobacteria bacterium]|nr:hypothetical protein [Deltaproteobacteria bacterium]
MRVRHLPSAATLVAFLAFACPSAAEPSPLSPTFAYDYGATNTPRSLGVGAMHALGAGLTAVFLNPANLGLTRAYHAGALAQFTPEGARQLYGGAVMDSTRRFAGGMSFIGGFQDPDGIDRTTVDARAAIAFAASKLFHLGLGGRYLTVEQDGLGPLGNSRASGGLVDPEDAPHVSGAPGRKKMLGTFTFDAGATIRLIEALSISAYGHNLTYRDDGLLPMVVGGGVGFGNADLSVEVDAEADLTTYEKASPRIMAGAEYLVAGRVPVRAGYRLDTMGGPMDGASHESSGGLGYVEPRYGVEASVRRTVTGPEATMIAVSVTYHIDSLGLPVQSL